MSYSKIYVIPPEEYIQLTRTQNDQQPMFTQLQDLARKVAEIE